jgi:ribokinase
MRRDLVPRPRIVVLGSSNTDLIVRLPSLPRPGETVLGGALLTAAGGKGANQAVAAARAGGAVTFIARVGRDAFGTQARRDLETEDIDVRFVRADARQPSGVALICVSAKGENSIAVASGANAKLSAKDVLRARAAIRAAAVLVVQLEVPITAVAAGVQLAADSGVPVILNPAPARRLERSLLRRVSILTPNEQEAAALTGARDPGRAARALLAAGVGTVIVTLGARGALLVTPEYERLIPGFRVRAIDTTAAGDVFNGALAAALAEGQSLPVGVRFANAAAALSVAKLGAQLSAPKRPAIERLLARPSLRIVRR